MGGARITTADSTSRTQTDATGGFRLEIPAGRALELRVSAVGYRPAIVRLAAVNAGTVRIVPVTLAIVYLLDPLSVVANPERPLLNTENATTGGARVECGCRSGCPKCWQRRGHKFYISHKYQGQR